MPFDVFPTLGCVGSVEYGHHHVGGGRGQIRRKHPSLAHDHQNPFESERETARRDALTQKHPDQVVVAAATPKTAGEVGHVRFHDGAGVVGQAASQAGIERGMTCGRGVLCEFEDLSQVPD